VQVEKETGLQLRKARLSGNPVAWERGNGAERLVMVHTRPKQHAYAHWLIRVNAERNEVVAISKGPVLESSSFRLRGYFPGVLVVGSFHLVENEDKKQVCPLICRCLPSRAALWSCQRFFQVCLIPNSLNID
jgi:hypothetical protein